MAKSTRITPRQIEAVDDLGHLKAKIAPLIEEKVSLEEFLLGTGHDEIDGELFRATLVRCTRKQIAWKKIAEKLGASIRQISANTSKTKVESVRVVARKAS